MVDGLREKLAVYGQWTYRGAWALEITAAFIGLLTGLVLGYRGSMASEQVTAMDLALASAPFFMVAIAELTKNSHCDPPFFGEMDLEASTRGIPRGSCADHVRDCFHGPRACSNPATASI